MRQYKQGIINSDASIALLNVLFIITIANSRCHEHYSYARNQMQLLYIKIVNYFIYVCNTFIIIFRIQTLCFDLVYKTLDVHT